MYLSTKDRIAYSIGVLVSSVLHLISVVIIIFILEANAATGIKEYEVFTVTIEGGEALGGFSQVPQELNNKEKPPLNALPNNTDNSLKEFQKETQKELEKPSVVEDPAKLAKIAAEKKAEEQKKKEIEKKEAEKETAKKKLEQQKREQEELAKKQKEAEKAARDRQLQTAVSDLKKRYEGESAAAGGHGFGAASLGGKGMGGGTVMDLERLAYRNQLISHIKQGWHWLRENVVYQAEVEVRILPSGLIQNARITKGSGNSSFDDSVMRAVSKASPVPPAPSKFYEDFNIVNIVFDSHE